VRISSLKEELGVNVKKFPVVKPNDVKARAILSEPVNATFCTLMNRVTCGNVSVCICPREICEDVNHGEEEI
jgi:hypothetical protein